MGLIIDTCIFIMAERRNQSMDFSPYTSYENVYISAITASELLVGVHRANTEARRLKRSAFVETIISEVPILNFTAKTARLHAELYASLAEQGQLIGAHDLIIAATALMHDYPILTANQNEFIRVPGLKVLNYDD